METNPIYASSGCPKTWTIRNRYGRTYAKFCIFPSVYISNGRRLTRLRDIRTCGTKSGVLYASPWYTSCKLGGRCSVLQKKINMCEIIINDLLLLVISTKSAELVLYASDMFRFIWSWTCSGRNHLNKKGLMIYMEPCDTPIPTIISTQTRVALGMDVKHGLMTIMRSKTTRHN